MGSFVRKVKTSSGATAVQIVHKRGRLRLGIDHIGSAHDQAELELLLQVAWDRLAQGQDQLDLGWEVAGRSPGQVVVESTAWTVLWDTLSSVYDGLGFDVLGDVSTSASWSWPGSWNRPRNSPPSGSWTVWA